MNEQTNKLRNKWTREQRNQWKNELTNESNNEAIQMNEVMKWWTEEQMKKRNYDSSFYFCCNSFQELCRNLKNIYYKACCDRYIIPITLKITIL